MTEINDPMGLTEKPKPNTPNKVPNVGLSC